MMLSSKCSSLLSRVAVKAAGGKNVTTRLMSSTPHTFDLTGSFETHNLDAAPAETVTATKEELLDMFQLMYTMRRMEITCDNEYKARTIRGFCHLYDGQEAVATGINTALDVEDSWATSYRCHCVALARGGTVSQVIGELFGVVDGYSRGKGGSMHMYNKKHNFYGGAGIVGAQVPLGTGCAFANKYKAQQAGSPTMNVAIGCYGDGAANQGQCWEAANMANLWKLVSSQSFEDEWSNFYRTHPSCFCLIHFVFFLHMLSILCFLLLFVVLINFASQLQMVTT